MPTLYTQAIAEAYAVAKTNAVVINTLEITHQAWAAPILITNTGSDFSAFDENNVYKTFINTGFDLGRTEKDDQGRVGITVQLDNTSRTIKTLIDQAIESNEYPIITFRVYLSSDITQPAEYPLVLRVESSTASLLTISLKCSNDDDINRQFPRQEFDYKAANFPGLVR